MSVTDVADAIYLAGDFSAIQRFVLRVKAAGDGAGLSSSPEPA